MPEQSIVEEALLFSMRTPWIFSAFWILLGAFSLYVNLS
jgi:hypothetical protein